MASISSCPDVLSDFHTLDRDIPCTTGFVRIGDFDLTSYTDGNKIIPNAKVGFALYGASLESLPDSEKPLIVVIPALTGNARIFAQKSSQGSGWANGYGAVDGILDPEKYIIIGLDYFGGPYDSSGPHKHDLDFYPVPPEKQVEAWKKALKALGVTQIERLFGGSNGGGHIHQWLFSDEFIPKTLIPIAGPVYPEPDAREFFQLHVDFIKKREDVSARLRANVSSLQGRHTLYDFFLEFVIRSLQEVVSNWDNQRAIQVARWIGFLKFVNPEFFQKFFTDMQGNDLDIERARENMISFFEHEGDKFEHRFGLSSLALLCEGIAHTRIISPAEYAKKVSKSVDLILVGFRDDALFDARSLERYFSTVRDERKALGHSGRTEVIILETTEILRRAGHDAFLWPEVIPDISQRVNRVMSQKFTHTKLA